METFDRHSHWEHLYKHKSINEVSWYQPSPDTSLEFIGEFAAERNARIIDVGGGDSFLADKLLEAGYSNITVLDISETAVARAKKRLGDKARLVRWIVADAARFIPDEQYDVWHDRAAFHFLTDEQDIRRYVEAMRQGINEQGFAVMGTFSEQGPKKCSGIEIRQYSETTLSDRLREFFTKIRCISVDHTTPFETVQNFLFCSFRKRTGA